ncbi:hypothetical protein J4219_03685 [Candidatus Woesearchaeota archaeon]|nr:hypothetical protein [Candidatus Woesearchaeota archaeon]
MLSIALVRTGLSVVFLYMGVDKFLRPDVWVIQMPPQMASTQIVSVLGGLEILIGVLLLTKMYKFGALGASGILVGAIGTLGLNDIAVRDFGLLLSALSLLFQTHKGIEPKDILRSYTDLFKKHH